MRTIAVIFSFAVLGGCLCAPDTPKSVTLRLKNTSRDTLFVDATDGGLGMSIERYVAGGKFGFPESPPCACKSCDMACSLGACECPAATPLVQRVASGQSFERSWSGVVMVQSSAACGGFGGMSCLSPENAPYNETFNLHFCYALSAPGAGLSPDGGPVQGKLPSEGVICLDRDFRIDDGVVEVSPRRGADCVTTTDCKGEGELCFSGACTASCPDNGYPMLGNNWAVRVLPPDDQGFFTLDMSSGVSVWTGSGTVSSATYNGTGTSLTVRLTRSGPSGEALNGTVYLNTPPGSLGPLAVGQRVSVRVVDASTSENRDNGALVIRDDTGVLLMAAETAQGGAILSAADTAPFTVTVGADVIGCRFTPCGKELFEPISFSNGDRSLSLEPGQSGNVLDLNGTYRAMNVFSGSEDAAGACTLKEIHPYLIWRDRAP